MIMKKILVPIDFSPASRNAEEYAAALAKVLGWPLQLVHVYWEPAPAPELSGAYITGELSLQEENEEWVEEEVMHLKAKFDVEATGEAQAGLKGDTINELAKETEAALVVMGMKESKRHRLVQSTVFTALRRTRVPVLVVPEEVRYQPLRHIVLAADFTGVRDTSCFELLFTLIEQLGASLQVVHVAGKEAAIRPEELPGKLQLGRLLAKVTYWYHQLDSDNVEESILRFTESHPADLLVMVAHRHSLFDRLLGTLYTRDLSYQASIPLLVLEEVQS